MDEFYRTYFVPFWPFVDVLWCAIGLWCVIRPAILVESFGGLITPGDGFAYGARIGRVGGCACIVAGLLGLFTSIDPAVIASLAVFALIWSAALSWTIAMPSSRRFIPSRDSGHRVSTTVVSVAGPLAIAAAALLFLGGFASITVGLCTIAIVVAIWRIGSMPSVVPGANSVSEPNADTSLRWDRFGNAVSLSPLPLLVWVVTSYADGPGPMTLQVVRLIVEAALVFQIALQVNPWRKPRRDIATGA